MKRFKQMAQWSLRESLNSLGVFFAVYTAVVVVTITLFNFLIDIDMNNSTFGLGSGIIFLFIMGIVLFAMYLRVGLANGVSRKTIFAAFVACAVVMSAGAAVGELLLALLAGTVLGVKDMYAVSLTGVGTGMPVNLLSALCSGIAITALGMFIGGAYYRMNKLAKIAVSISVPVVLVFGLGAGASFLPKSTVDFLINQIFLPVVKFFTGSPWTYMAGCLMVAAALLAFVYLLLRRAPAKAAQ